VPDGSVLFDRVWKRFRRGERHHSLRDLIPSMVGGALWRSRTNDLHEDEFWALQDVSFEVKPGEALGIIGPNGAGKSTALKLLTRILKPTRGRCEIRGRTGALIDLSTGFHMELTGRENIYLRGAILGMKRAETAAKFDEIVAFAGLADFIDTPIKRYSSGMNARLGFAIAAQMNPDVLIVDEVLGVGDIEFRQRCHDRMSALKQAGVAIVVVSHNLSAIRALCDRALLLKRGVADYLGPAAAAVRRYNVPRTIHSTPNAAGEPTLPGPRVVGPLTVLSVSGPAGRDRRELHPGDPLTVRLQVAPNRIASDSVLMTHIRAHDSGLVASSTRQRLDLAEWSRRTDGFDLVVVLTLNLLRGPYAVRFSLIDPARQTRLRSPAIRIRIKEAFSASGVAHVLTTATAAPSATAPRPG
jgi:lipopolysaccharide transport system ATP-binding protein